VFNGTTNWVETGGLKMSEEFGTLSADSATLRIARNAFRLRIGFNLPDNAAQDVCISSYREQLLQLIEVPECSTVTFDMTGINSPPSGLVGLLSSAQEQGCDVELLNPSPEVQEVLRLAKLDSCLLVRGATRGYVTS
jgi:hypothetical protein